MTTSTAAKRTSLLTRVLLWLLLGAILVGTVLGMYAVLADWPRGFEEVWMSIFLLTPSLASCFAASAVLDRRQSRLAMTISLLLVGGAVVLFLGVIWTSIFRGNDDGWVARLATAMLVIGYGLSLRGVLGLLRLNTRTLQVTRTIVVTSLWLLTGLIAFLVLAFELIEGGSSFALAILIGISIGVLALVVAAGLIALPIGAISKANRAVAETKSMSSAIRLTMGCPRCGQEQEFKTGVARCTACKTALTIDVEEPRCECGYLLYRLTGSQCPECGRPVQPEHIWHAQMPAASAPATTAPPAAPPTSPPTTSVSPPLA